MSIAVKCNRCHICFDPLDQGMRKMVRFRNPYLRTAEDIRKHKLGESLIENGDEYEYIDLCPDCSEDWLLFMEGYILAIHDNDFDKPDVEPSITKDLNEMFANAVERINKFGRDLGFKE